MKILRVIIAPPFDATQNYDIAKENLYDTGAVYEFIGKNSLMIFESYGYLTVASIMFALVLSGSVKGIFDWFPVVAGNTTFIHYSYCSHNSDCIANCCN